MMGCKNCKTNPVIRLTNSEIKLCKKCFINYFEKKVQKNLRKFRLIDKGDRIAVACSGGKDSTVVLYILKNLLKDRTLKIQAIAIDEGIHDYRDKSLEFLKKFCEEQEVKLSIYSYKKEFGKSLDEILKTYKGIPCSVCGVLRRYLLNKKSKELDVNKLATGHNLDDEAQSVLMNIFRNNIKITARLGPINGIKTDKRFIKRIKPLYLMTEKEITTYAYLKGLMDKFTECPHDTNSYRAQVRDILNDFEAKHEGTKHGIMMSFLELLPMLKNNYKESPEINSCKVCEEPCSQEICQACRYVEEVVKGNKIKLD